MTWTYDTSLSTDLAKVRFLVGDTDTNFQQLSDEEINSLISQYSSVLRSSIQAIKGLISKYSFKNNETVGKISVNYDNVIKALSDRLKQLELEALNSGLGIYAGGISKTIRETIEDNTDIIKPFFTRDTHTNADEDDD